MDTDVMTLQQALAVFRDLGRGTRERQVLALEILDVLDHSSLASITQATVPASPWLATDGRRRA